MEQIETARLILRNFAETDADDLYEYLSDPAVVAFEPYQPMTREETIENLKWRISTDEMIAVELKQTHHVIGNIYLGKRECENTEIGYVFNKSIWGQGYATEACMKLMQKCFEEGTHRIYAMCDPANPNSWKLQERLGFIREAHLSQNVYFWKDASGKPIWKDTYIYAMLERAGK